MGSIAAAAAVTPELSLELKPTYVHKSINLFLREISVIGNVSERLSKLDDYIHRLEDEMKKIDAFKRELPLCMLLLNDAILILKEQTLHCTTSSSTTIDAHPVMEQFIPLMKNNSDDGLKKEKVSKDKMSWMSSAQLWSSNSSQDEKKKSPVERPIEEVADECEALNTLPMRKFKKLDGAFLPFKGFNGFPATMPRTVRKEDKEVPQPATPSLSLSPPSSEEQLNSRSRNVQSSAATTRTNPPVFLQNGTPQPPSRKHRRCWSPDLHRRFVSALQQLGGSQVATPKQIRELMKVDGLTNDEVKSHLQKYRLHTRRAPNSSSTTAANEQQGGVVLGGLWVSSSQDNDYGSSKSGNSESESPQGPLQLAATNGGVSTTCGDDSMEDEEDRRSESYSWKGHLHKPVESDA
ncbi:hypothetical protein C5167_010856 [Papaver somniferum]|uniref:HTH myb-type domain-containing protein n=1 Tax=Papaver somniferum TaxID=3469 RepID=A0A4Y7K4B3_PAPSO|nr:transcription factor HHO6-like [Papaver somniferum]RZC67172.1 hypothetical protein C5167_010856 [Papaver somniferum]